MPFPFKDLDLKSRIAIFTVALFVCAIWLLAHDLDVESRADFRKVLAAQQFATVEHVANSLDVAAQLRIHALADAASLIRPAWMTRPDRLRDFLAGQKPLRSFFDMGMFVISPKGKVVAGLANADAQAGTDYSDRDYFHEVMATGTPAVGKPVRVGATKEPAVVVGVPIRDGANEIIGVLVGADRVSGGNFLGEVIPRKPHAGGDYHVISPRDGLIVTSTNRDLVLQPDPPPGIVEMYDRYKQGYEGSGIFSDPRGTENLSSGKRVPSTNWLVIATLPTSLAFEPIDTLHREIYRDATLAAAAIALLLWGFLYRQLTPLARSAAILDDMAHGRVPLAPLPVKGGKEIGRLLGSFNQLQQHISEQDAALRKNTAQLQLAASVFDGTSEAVLISSADNRIIAVNRAFCRMTGYAESELVGQNPRLLQSGRHDPRFYQEMWSSLWNTGQWEGEIWNRRKDGEIYPERLSISTLYDADGKVQRRIAIGADITRQKQAAKLIWKQANYDLLTHLPNRRLLRDRMHQEMKRAEREKLSMGLLFVDLDGFKGVNDTLGHAAGDRVLIAAAERIAACVRTSDTVAHLGGDEFAIVFASLDDSSRLDRLAQQVLDVLAEPFVHGLETAYVTATIGITMYPADSGDIDELLKNADQALSAAKAQGCNRYCYFTASMQQAAQMRMQLANDLRGALAGGQLEVYYQPIVDLASGQAVKAEALLRWRHPERGMVSPAEFIPIAEETGLIVDIGDWVFRQAAQMARRWCGHCEFMTEGGCSMAATPDMACRFQIGVNKSPRQFITGNTGETWIEHLQELQISPRCIAIEITEGLLLNQHAEVKQKLHQFRDAGIQIALDDFGTGYSAMSYLKKFDIDTIKIDQSFVRGIATDPSDLAIAEAVIAMAHKLGMKVVAEGVETAAQLGLLLAAGCDYAQGYLFARPMPAAQFEDFIAPNPDDGDVPWRRQIAAAPINAGNRGKEETHV